MITTFKQAKRLRDLGFDGDCICFYMFNKDNPDTPDSLVTGKELKDHNGLDHLNTFIGYHSAPSVSDALQWIRDNKGIECGVYPSFVPNLEDGKSKLWYEFEGYCSIWGEKNNATEEFCNNNDFPSFPLAEAALLDDVLTYLEKKRTRNASKNKL